MQKNSTGAYNTWEQCTKTTTVIKAYKIAQNDVKEKDWMSWKQKYPRKGRLESLDLHLKKNKMHSFPL